MAEQHSPAGAAGVGPDGGACREADRTKENRVSEVTGESAGVALDLSKPMNLRAEMARRGLVFNQLLPYEDLEHGHTDPLDDPEVRVEVRRFMGQVWQAALRAEAKVSASPTGGDQ